MALPFFTVLSLLPRCLPLYASSLHSFLSLELLMAACYRCILLFMPLCFFLFAIIIHVWSSRLFLIVIVQSGSKVIIGLRFNAKFRLLATVFICTYVCMSVRFVGSITKGSLLQHFLYCECGRADNCSTLWSILPKKGSFICRRQKSRPNSRQRFLVKEIISIKCMSKAKCSSTHSSSLQNIFNK